MKILDRLNIIDKIGRELQARMTYVDIDVYLKAHGVDIKKATSGANSKWVYTKELLSDASDELILRIADELNIIHSSSTSPVNAVVEATFWTPSHFKLFLSHLSGFKKNTSLLQKALKRFGISAFVAHVDIEPTKEWLDEIEAGLNSMDALAALLMPGFKESSWTDQEVGFAVGRGVLIIPIIKGLNPYGFISKYQGLHADGKTVTEVADAIFQILTSSPKTRTRMLGCLVETTLQSVTTDEALEKLNYIESIKNLPIQNLERLREGAPASAVLSEGKALIALNKILAQHKLKPVTSSNEWEAFLADDIPF